MRLNVIHVADASPNFKTPKAQFYKELLEIIGMKITLEPHTLSLTPFSFWVSEARQWARRDESSLVGQRFSTGVVIVLRYENSKHKVIFHQLMVGRYK